MIFNDPINDDRLNKELLDNQVFSLADFQSFRKGEEGTLMGVVMDNADAINSEKWVFWLVKHHGFARYCNPRVDMEWLRKASISKALTRRFIDASVYPLGPSGRAMLVGCARPDKKDVLEGIKQELNALVVYQVAIAPTETRAIDSIYQEFLARS